MPDDPRASGRGDAELIAATRAGDNDAYALLYQRHAGAAQRFAQSLARDPSDANDLVSEAFTRLLTALRDGRGPDVAFRSYLLSTVRNAFYDGTRRDRRIQVTGDMSKHDRGTGHDDPVVAGEERSLVARAFSRLPERWRAVLWHTEVEGEGPSKVAPLFGVSPNAVAVLAYRAREGLRRAYLDEHVAGVELPAACQQVVDRLGAHVRDGLSTRERDAVARHLDGCERCCQLHLELWDVNTSLGGLLAPAVLGAAAGYTLPAGPPRGVRRLLRRRPAQAGAVAAAATAVAATVALVALLTNDTTIPDAAPAPPGGTAAPATIPVPTAPAWTGSPTPVAQPSPTPSETPDPAGAAGSGGGESAQPQQPDETLDGGAPRPPEATGGPGGESPPGPPGEPTQPPQPPGEEPTEPPPGEEPPGDEECLELDLGPIELLLCLGLLS